MKKRIFSSILIALILIVMATFLYFSSMLGKIGNLDFLSSDLSLSADAISGDASADAELQALLDLNGIDPNALSSEHVTNILLIGYDLRTYETEEDANRVGAVDTSSQRSDTMIILSINQDSNQVSLVSLMRDMYVPIPGYNSNRLNTAFALGGADLLEETIETDFGIEISGTVAVDLAGFLDAMDVVGDVDVELTAAEADYINNHSKFGTADDKRSAKTKDWTLTEGMNTLTPNQALAYARVRKFGNSDYDRTTRQRKLLLAIYQKVIKSSLTDQLAIANELLPCFSTNISTNDLLNYVYVILANHMEMRTDMRLPIDGAFTSSRIRGMSVLVPDLAASRAALQLYLYGDTNVEMEGVDVELDSDNNIVIKSSRGSSSSYDTSSDYYDYSNYYYYDSGSSYGTDSATDSQTNSSGSTEQGSSSSNSGGSSSGQSGSTSNTTSSSSGSNSGSSGSDSSSASDSGSSGSGETGGSASGSDSGSSGSGSGSSSSGETGGSTSGSDSGSSGSGSGETGGSDSGSGSGSSDSGAGESSGSGAGESDSSGAESPLSEESSVVIE
jgi:polyisoprenyl-teichoic acid--peptidoglycan teichoic acid transferase